MFIRQVRWVALLVGTPLLTQGQQAVPAGLPPVASGLAGKTFLIDEADPAGKAANDAQFYFIFQPDGRAVFRRTRGQAVLKDSPLGWRMAVDSLFLIPGAVLLEAAGTTQRIERAVSSYAVTKVCGGYLLQGKAAQILLMEVK
ncbi:MAG: hypothetical protein ACRYG7_14680 [Janthinobacterium lividum]